jgi:aquaporin Z
VVAATNHRDRTMSWATDGRVGPSHEERRGSLAFTRSSAWRVACSFAANTEVHLSKPLVELIGTFFLVTTVAFAAVAGNGATLAPLAIATVLAVMVYAGAHVSGANYNPAVSLGLVVRKVLSPSDLVPYVVSQIIGGVAAAGLFRALHPEPVHSLAVDLVPALIAEALFTFALVYTVLHVATAPANKGNSYFGVAIGGAVLAGACAVGAISGGAFNPAVAIGLGVMGVLEWPTVGAYVVVELIAGASAAMVYLAATRETAAA